LAQALDVKIIGKGKTIFFGMIPTCLNISKIRLQGDVFLRVTRKMSFPFAMIMHVEATSFLKRPLRRFFKVDSIGHPFFVMPMLIVQPASDARNWGVLEEGI
jgi:hypothetical protein